MRAGLFGCLLCLLGFHSIERQEIGQLVDTWRVRAEVCKYCHRIVCVAAIAVTSNK